MQLHSTHSNRPNCVDCVQKNGAKFISLLEILTVCKLNVACKYVFTYTCLTSLRKRELVYQQLATKYSGACLNVVKYMEAKCECS